ncbi:porin [Campylobacter sp. faydin G-140]|uniref:major outer membrane protein n=1 Tax=Campylobacter anatolicus TaxID=2829105 RepID=UPI001B90E225|nr:major outer membrane protein [Campylobacter anatolicus]MBR8464877.1 porin [Campylobacter anatolicus]
MRLAKLSLATIVALGAFSSIACATPLEEAIKNVDVSGYARYRYTNDTNEDKNVKDTKADHRFRVVATFKAAIDDNFFGVLGLRYDARDGSGSREKGTDLTDTTGTFGVWEAYVGYSIGNTTITAGKQLIKTYFDDGDISGTGIKIMNKDIEGLTLTAAAFDAISNYTFENDGPLLKDIKADNFDANGNLYLVGAMGTYDPVAFSVWYANLTDVAAIYAGDIALNFNINDIKLSLKGQYAHNEADHKDYTDGDFYGVQAGVGAFGVKFNAGYINYSADDKDVNTVGKSFVSLDANGKFINPSKILQGVMSGSKNYYNNIIDDNEFWFVNASYTYDKYSIGAGYTDGEGYSHKLSVVEADRSEWYAQLGYKHSKKLNFTTWYASAKDEKGGKEFTQDRVRFEARYNF